MVELNCKLTDLKKSLKIIARLSPHGRKASAKWELIKILVKKDLTEISIEGVVERLVCHSKSPGLVSVPRVLLMSIVNETKSKEFVAELFDLYMKVNNREIRSPFIKVQEGDLQVKPELSLNISKIDLLNATATGQRSNLELYDSALRVDNFPKDVYKTIDKVYKILEQYRIPKQAVNDFIIGHLMGVLDSKN